MQDGKERGHKKKEGERERIIYVATYFAFEEKKNKR